MTFNSLLPEAVGPATTMTGFALGAFMAWGRLNGKPPAAKATAAKTARLAIVCEKIEASRRVYANNLDFAN